MHCLPAGPCAKRGCTGKHAAATPTHLLSILPRSRLVSIKLQRPGQPSHRRTVSSGMLRGKGENREEARGSAVAQGGEQLWLLVGPSVQQASR